MNQSLQKTLIKLGIFYKNTNRFNEANKAFKQAQEIYERLVQKDAEQYEPDLAETFTNSAFFYQDRAQLSLAKSYFLEAKKLYEKYENYLSLVLLQLAYTVPDISTTEKNNYLKDAVRILQEYPNWELSRQMLPSLIPRQVK